MIKHVLTSVALMAFCLPAQAATLACSSETILDSLIDQGEKAMVMMAPMFVGKDDAMVRTLRLELSDIFETDRTQFTRQCSATMTAKGQDGISGQVQIDYRAILTEDGRLIYQWPEATTSAKAMLVGALMAQVAKAQAEESRNGPRSGSAADLTRKWNQGNPNALVGAPSGQAFTPGPRR